jgi:hypothetical protein
LKGVSKLLHCLRTFVYERLEAFELKVSYFFGSVDPELLNEGCDKGSAVVRIPMIRKSSVVFLLVEALSFGMFLNKSEEDAGSPLL